MASRGYEDSPGPTDSMPNTIINAAASFDASSRSFWGRGTFFLLNESGLEDGH